MILSDGKTAVILSDAMIFEQHTWQPVAQALSYSLSGSLFVDESVKKAGQKITLYSEKNGTYYYWFKREVIDTLLEMASKPNQQLTLTRFNKVQNVTFRHDSENEPAVQAEPLIWYEKEDEPDDYWLLTLRLITI